MDDALNRLDLPVLAVSSTPAPKTLTRMRRSLGRTLYAEPRGRELRAEESVNVRVRYHPAGRPGPPSPCRLARCAADCQAAPFALAAVRWGDRCRDCALGYAWGWLENQVAAAIKLVPLGQTDGQRVQLALAERLPHRRASMRDRRRRHRRQRAGAGDRQCATRDLHAVFAA